MTEQNLEQDYKFQLSKTKTDLFSALLRARKTFGKNEVALVDGDGRKLTYTDLARACFGLGSALKKHTKSGEAVGVMLPTGVGAIVVFYALLAFGRIPAMLNFTAGSRNLKAAMKAGKITKIITANQFVELGALEPLIAELSDSAELIYIEDVREGLSAANKITAALGPVMPALFRRAAHHTKPGVYLFTSGTEGAPKGVVLSHQNIMANVEQVRAHIRLDPKTDSVFNPLPTFHCFGLTVGAVLPLISGVKAICHPTPLQPKEIAKRVKKTKSTILLATDTFISQYTRAGSEGDLSSVRLAVCGAERVRDETRALVRKKFNIEILEGYGATEAAPVIAANRVGANKPGTVGQFMSQVEHELLPVEGIEEGGRLRVRGPNVMQGYLRPSNPGVLEQTNDGWHDTGDIVAIDSEGFIRILGRVKRFAKIGGEMVSLAVVENCASAIWPDSMHAAAALPDPRKGEQIILLSDAKEANRDEVLTWCQNHGTPEIAVPRKVLFVEKIPVLGTGKLDYGTIQKLAEDLTAG